MVVFLTSVIPAFQVATDSSIPQQIQSKLGLGASDSVTYFKIEEIAASEIDSALRDGFVVGFCANEYQSSLGLIKNSI